MALLEVNSLSKFYDAPAVADISLSLEKGNILCLLGPSGCGKTTLLRLIAGLEQPDGGRVVFDGRDVTEIAAHRRKFGMMFQDFALFPHKNVYENVAFGLEMLKLEKGLIRKRTTEMLALTGLSSLARRSVAELSGGEKQRVALARSLAPRPKLIMLDEPMGSLDRSLRERLLIDIRAILKELEATAIFVTHDQSEAFGLADRVAVMNHGRIEQEATPEDLYRHPGNVFVAQFLGFRNLLKGTLTVEGAVKTGIGVFTPGNTRHPTGKKVTLLLRPEGACLVKNHRSQHGHGVIRGRVTGQVFIGHSFRINITVGDGFELTFDLPNHEPPPGIGESILLAIDRRSMSVI
jgi:ABC-type Fe3+/spermidine/putrescine transport system ATPase subunit